ncbi:L,D-transpeptidase [Robiginitalea sp. IMCC44478]|uniref:L,D-transpeptidase n=1 Tax=Robiginitalea sp. IMCC44478 TaxID=3459122 RepID=UPI0040416BE7
MEYSATFHPKGVLTILIFLSLSLTITCCRSTGNDTSIALDQAEEPEWEDSIRSPENIIVSNDVPIADYFQFIDSIVREYKDTTPYPLTEHILVRYNSWIIDTLSHTDYYYMMDRDSFVFDQRKMTVLPKGSLLKLPDSATSRKLLEDFSNSWIDINIPEFKLRLFRDSIVIHSFPIRVGQNRSRYLVMDQRVTDLRTQTGIGRIVAHVKNPDFYNPVDGKRFYSTKRDDGRVTLMPQIPWIETEINGIRNGQMIHPTTNPKTLGKAYSNGCIGVREGDSWTIYYNAPIGTKVRIRYDLNLIENGKDTLHLKDIYGYSSSQSKPSL